LLQKNIILTSFLLLLVLTGSYTHAQHRQPENLPKYDLAPYHFGFILGGNQMFFAVKPAKDFLSQDTVYAVYSKPDIGFNIGIVTNLRLGTYFDLRFIPTLSFGERAMVFTHSYKDSVFYNTEKKVESTYLDFPLELKFKSRRLHNSRAYVLTGIRYSIDLASQAKKKADDEEIRIKLKKNDYALEIGVGFDFYTNFFKFGTELKMAYGFRDLLYREDNIYAASLDKLNSKIFQLTFTFE